MARDLKQALDGATRRLVELSCENRLGELADAGRGRRDREASKTGWERNCEFPRGYRRPTTSR